VANLGQSWYGPDQELEVLRRYGLKLAPKVCVWIFYEGNDLSDMFRYKKATQDWEMYSKDFHSFLQRSFSKNAVFALGQFLHSLQPQRESPMEQWKEQSGIFRSASGQETRLFFYYKGLHLSNADRIAIEDLRVILGQAHNLCQDAGAKFLLIFAPTKFRVYRDFTEFDTYAQARYWVVNDLPQIFRTIVHEDFPDGGYLDLTTVLSEQARQKPLLYFDNDTHWTAEGHRIIASAIANIVRQWE